MQDLFLSVVGAFEAPSQQSNFIVFRNSQPAVPTAEGAAYFKKCKQYAKKHNAFVVTGLLNIADYLCLCMFAPNGRICGAQRALLLSKANRETFRKAGNLALFDTPFGKVFLCVDADIYSPEVQRHARLGGCEILVSSQYLPPEDYGDQKLFTGAWGAAQTNNLLVVSATNHAGAICAPYLATIDNTGYVCKPAPSVFSTFNVSRLYDTHSDYHSSHFNTKLFENHLAQLL